MVLSTLVGPAWATKALSPASGSQTVARLIVELGRTDAAVHRAPLPKFLHALRDHDRSLTSSEGRQRTWATFLSRMEAGDRRSLLRAVNEAVNKIRYQSDGPTNVWLSPVEFLERGAGDCEDYALAKYAALRAHGVPADEMALLVIVLPGVGPHAVLAVAEGSRFLILDNRTAQISQLGRTELGRVLYAVNEIGTELFLPARGVLTASGAR